MLIYKRWTSFPQLIKQTGILTVVRVSGITIDLRPDQNNCLGFHLLGWGWRNAHHECVPTKIMHELLYNHKLYLKRDYQKRNTVYRYLAFLCIKFRLFNLPCIETDIKMIIKYRFLPTSVKHQSFPPHINCRHMPDERMFTPQPFTVPLLLHLPHTNTGSVSGWWLFSVRPVRRMTISQCLYWKHQQCGGDTPVPLGCDLMTTSQEPPTMWHRLHSLIA